MLNKIRFWIPLGVTIFLLYGAIYAVVQQNYRLSLNDPQIQIAEDTANLLNSGKKPQEVVGTTQVDIAKSLAPFVIVYNDNLQVATGSGQLSGKTPTPPSGVFYYAKNYSQHRLTWQPANDVRIATVLQKYNAGYVLAGRNMREVEKREQELLKRLVFAGLITWAASFLAVLIFTPSKK